MSVIITQTQTFSVFLEDTNLGPLLPIKTKLNSSSRYIELR